MTVDCHFERDTHAYTVEGGRRVMSVTQVLQLAGLVDYDGIPAAVLEYAAWRGTLVHEATMYFDRGVDVEGQFDLPAEVFPYFRAYEKFRRECEFAPVIEEIERPRVVVVRGIEYGMTPDRLGAMNGLPTVLEIKATAAAHPAWGIQLAGYEAGVPRPARFRNYQRVAVQLMPDATYRLHTFSEASDFDLFAHAYSVAAWRLNSRIAKLAA